MSYHQEAEADPITFQPADDLIPHDLLAEPFLDFPPIERVDPMLPFSFKIDASMAMSGAPYHVLYETTRHGRVRASKALRRLMLLPALTRLSLMRSKRAVGIISSCRNQPTMW